MGSAPLPTTEKPITVLYAPFGPSDNPSPALGDDSKVGATEVVFFYFSSALGTTEKDAIMSSIEKMRPIMERSESLSVYDGWPVEEEVPNRDPRRAKAREGEMCKVYIDAVG